MTTTAAKIASIDAEIAALQGAKKLCWDDLTVEEIDEINDQIDSLRSARRAAARTR